MNQRVDLGKVIGPPGGFGEVKGAAHSLSPGSLPTVKITKSGEGNAKNFDFEFGIPLGNTGPNIITKQTASELSGLLKGADGAVAAAQAYEDYLPPVNVLNALPASGVRMERGAYYNGGTITGAYVLSPPILGEAAGNFFVGEGATILFRIDTPNVIGTLPTFESGRGYEFKVANGVWNIQERTNKTIEQTSQAAITLLSGTQSEIWYLSETAGYDPSVGKFLITNPTTVEIKPVANNDVSMFAGKYFANTTEATTIYSVASGAMLVPGTQESAETGEIIAVTISSLAGGMAKYVLN